MLGDAMTAGVAQIGGSAMIGRYKLTDALLERNTFGFDAFAAMPSNVQAIEAVLLFSSGLQQLVALYGPSGWGKSHLLSAASNAVKHNSSQTVTVLPALQWLVSQPRSEGHGPLILDDVEDAISRPRGRQQLRVAFDRRVRSGRPTLVSFTLPRADRQLRSFLPYHREWQIVEVSEPSNSERELVIRQMAASKDIVLSSKIVRLIATKLPGNGRSILGCLQRLKLDQDRWVRPADVVRSLGVLSPLLGDSNGWDGRDLVLEAVRAAAIDLGLTEPSEVLDICTYVMIRLAGFGEKETGAILGLDPGSVYSRCSRMEDLRGPSLQKLLGACERQIIYAVENC